MKSHPSPPSEKRDGVALITVMGILAILTGLVVAILTLTGEELKSARTYAESVRVRQLSQTVTNLVMGQIREATRPGKNVNMFGEAQAYTWSSQPGMIRSYASSRGFDLAYKLYSSSEMVIENKEALLRETMALTGWQNQPDRYVDLNRPDVHYDLEGTPVRYFFPILDPGSRILDRVEGFTWEDDRAAGLARDEEALQNGRELPMPVEWIYQLRDGSLGSLDPDGVFRGAVTPTEENPIVARLAYWTDDESCKINVNTASEGVTWDTPRAYTDEGREWATKQPVTNEVQRYPGHPSTTCLSSVLFPGLYPDGDGDAMLTPRHLEAIYELTPKVVHEGTQGGEKKAAEPAAFDQDRLYASVDELLFSIEREENRFLDLMEEAGEGGIARLERSRGFLTTTSRAPEINVHGRPRFCLWPLSGRDFGQTRSVYDDTIDFCTSLGANGKDKYFYQRTGSNLRHIELYVHGNRNNINLYRYLMANVYRKVPGYGESLAKKYGATKKAPYRDKYYRDKTEYKLDHFSLPLMMIDYVRATNIHDGNVRQPYARLRDRHGFGQIASNDLVGRDLVKDNGVKTQNGQWHEETLEPKGLGRIFTVSEIALVLYCTAECRLEGFDDQGRAVVKQRRGESSDGDVMRRILGNQKKDY
ncbi:MAG: Verru_Chthon cassette protein A, partial [Verrucomicrobiota bacterium]